MPLRVRFCPNFAPRPSMRVMDGCVLLAVVFALIRSNFTCYEALNRYFAFAICALNLIRSNFTQRYEALNRPFAISRLT
jgi:hypothetical protein